MPIRNMSYQNPIAVTMPTLREKLMDNLSEKTALRFVEFAEAKIEMNTVRGTRYNVRRIEDALDFCCDHPEAVSNYKTITEARKALAGK